MMYKFVVNYQGKDGFILKGTELKKLEKSLLERGIIVKIEKPSTKEEGK